MATKNVSRERRRPLRKKAHPASRLDQRWAGERLEPYASGRDGRRKSDEIAFGSSGVVQPVYGKQSAKARRPRLNNH